MRVSKWERFVHHNYNMIAVGIFLMLVLGVVLLR
jgi:hypothetical protein